MKLRLLEYLICPVCAASLEPGKDRMSGNEILDGLLRCRSCGRDYPVVRGIPRMIAENLSEVKERTSRAFGYEWTKFDFIGDTYERQFLKWIQPVSRDHFRGKIVLDAGCGKGRHMRIASSFGAADVVGIDLSEAVESAYKNTRHLPNAHVVQSDIYHPPLGRIFDYVYSVGVVHHLPDPPAAVRVLSERLRAGGTLSLWVYGRENNGWIVRLVNPLRKHITSRMPLSHLMDASFAVTVILEIVARGFYRPLNRSPLQRMAKRLFYNDYMVNISSFSFREVFSIVFDHLVAPVAGYYRKEEVAQWLTSIGMTVRSMAWCNRNSWSAWAGDGEGITPSGQRSP